MTAINLIWEFQPIPKKKERLLTFGGNFPGNFNPRSKSQNVSDFALLQKEKEKTRFTVWLLSS